MSDKPNYIVIEGAEVVGDMAVNLTYCHGYTMVMCACGRGFQGRDDRRVDEHFASHARRCTSARKLKRWLRAQAVKDSE